MKTNKYSGSAIILTVLAVAAMTTVALGVAQLVPRDFRQSQALEASLQAENAAWGGVEHALLMLKNAQKTNAFVSLSASAEKPYGSYTPAGTTNCITLRAACPGFDRQLGNVQNGKPVTLTSSLATPDANYSLLIWHNRETVGNIGALGLDDGLEAYPKLNQSKDAPNINPILERDEVRRLDIADVTSLTINWKPVWNDQCVYDGGRTKIWLLYALLDEQGVLIGNPEPVRGYSPSNFEHGVQIALSGIPTKAHALSLRLLATNTTNLDPTALEPTGDEKYVRGCFIRYNLDTRSSTSKAIDMGFDVVESTGVSGGVRRKIRVIVNRENGRLLNILDFGVACERCSGLD